MSHSMGFAIETLVALLLVVTIAYCWLLNKRLKLLKADEHALKATIGELITATEIAERAIGGLKLTVRDVNDNLRIQIDAANGASDVLRKQLMEGDTIIRRLSKIVSAGRPAAEPAPSADVTPISSAKAVAAAAQAFADRRRGDGLAA